MLDYPALHILKIITVDRLVIALVSCKIHLVVGSLDPS